MRLILLTSILLISTAHADEVVDSNYSQSAPDYTNSSSPASVYTNYSNTTDKFGCPLFDMSGMSSECACKHQAAKVEYAKQNAKALDDFSWQGLRNRQIVFIGDEHGMADPNQILELFARLRATSGKQCVFYEFPSSKNLDDLNQLVNTVSGNEETDRLRRYYKVYLQNVPALGYQAFLVDHPDSFSAGAVSDIARDQAMAKTIQSLFAQKKCDHAVMLVGKNHIGQVLYQFDGLKEQLTKSGFSVSALNPVFASEEHNHPMFFEEWNGLCYSEGDAQWTPTKPVIFDNSGIAGEPVFPKGPQINIPYGRFDYTILFPKSDFR